MDLTLSPLDVKGLHFKNRIFHTPTTLNFSDPRGYVSDQCVAAYESMARGGHAAVTVGATCVRWDGLINERMLGIYDDTYVIGFRPLVEAIHNNDALAGIQLFYGGLIPGLMATTPLPPGKGWIPDTVAWGPSDKMTIGNPKPGVVPTAVYEELVECFAQGARRAKEAGFDYVSFHFCHGSLPHTNLSLLSNVGRTDKYADHFLFCEEILQRTQEVCGKDFPLIPRLCCDENLEGGYDLEYFVEHYAPRLHKLGIAALDCTFGSMLKAKSRRPDIRSDEFIGSSFYSPRLVNLDNIKTIKRLLRAKGIDMPVVGSCKLCTADDVRAMVEKGGAELAGVCHLSMDDPEFPTKMMQGRDNEICKITHSGVLTSGNIFGKGMANSMQNPEFGHEREYKIIPTNRPKKVVIVGGGSGGMEYARVATLIGHKVVLFEKSPRLGGTMDWAGNYPHIPNTEAIRWEPEYRSLQVQKLKVDCRLGVTATSELILAEKPDVLVIATGARARLPAIDGLEAGRKRGFVLTMDEVMARDKPADPGAAPLIWGAGEGMELALELVRQGRKVRLIDPNPQVIPVIYLGYRSMSVLPWLAQAGVMAETGVAVTKVGDKSVTVSGSDAKLSEISCDSLIVCLGRESNTELKQQMTGKVPVIHVVGDARAPRSYSNALHEAAYLARQI